MKNDPIVIKIGGSTLGQNDTTTEDLVTLQKRGFNVVVVHGGGKDINEWLNKLSIKPEFADGLRVTDIDTLNVATAVLCGLVNKDIVSNILQLGGKAVGLCGVDGLIVEARNINPKLGFVGEDLKTNVDLILTLLISGYMPVIAPISYNIENKNNRLLNVNGDTIAAEIASALKAQKLIFLTDVPGLYGNDKNIINRIKAAEAKELIDKNVITGGMAVKIKSCIEALSKVSLTRIIDGRVNNALIKEIDGTGEGTTIEA